MARGRPGGPRRECIQLSDNGGSCHRDSFSLPNKENRASTDVKQPSQLVDEFGGGHQADALRLCFRQNFAQSLKRGGARMANRHGLALFAGTAERQFEPCACRGTFGAVVEREEL